MGLKNAIGKFFSAVSGSNLTDYYGPNYQERAAFLQKLQDQELQLKALAMTREQQQIEADKQRMANEAVRTAMAVGPSLARAGRIQDPNFVGPRLEDAGLPNPNREGLLGQKLDLAKVVPGLDPAAAETFNQIGEAEATRQDQAESDKRQLDWAKYQGELKKTELMGQATERDRYVNEQNMARVLAAIEGARSRRDEERKNWVPDANDPAGGHFVRNDGSIEYVRPTGGAHGSGETIKKKLGDVATLKAQIEEIRAGLSDENGNLSGVGPFGYGAAQEAAAAYLPEGVGIGPFVGSGSKAMGYGALAGLGNTVINTLSGTAVSKSEEQRLNRQLALTSNSPTALNARLNLATVAALVTEGHYKGLFDANPDAEDQMVREAVILSAQGKPVDPYWLLKKYTSNALPSGTSVPGRVPGQATRSAAPAAGVDPRAEDIFAKYDRPRQ